MFKTIENLWLLATGRLSALRQPLMARRSGHSCAKAPHKKGRLQQHGGPSASYTTQRDIYLDTGICHGEPDGYGGNMDCLLPLANAAVVTCKGTRFDYSSAINNSSGTHLRDFGFNVSTGLTGDDCAGFTPRYNECRPDRTESEPPRSPVYSHVWLVHVQAHAAADYWAVYSGGLRTRRRRELLPARRDVTNARARRT